MIVDILVGLVAMTFCLALQSAAGLAAMHYFNSATFQPLVERPVWVAFRRLAAVMALLMIGAIMQMAVWALLFRLHGEFGSFEEALYFSGITFTSLGYGDVLLSEQTRLLGPMEAANGLMMFGIATAIFLTAIQNSGRPRATTDAKGEAKQ